MREGGREEERDACLASKFYHLFVLLYTSCSSVLLPSLLRVFQRTRLN